MTDYAKKESAWIHLCWATFFKLKYLSYLKYVCKMPKVIKPYYELIPCQIFLLTLQHFSSCTNTKKKLNRKTPNSWTTIFENLF